MQFFRRFFFSLMILGSLSVLAYSGLYAGNNGLCYISAYSAVFDNPQPDIRFEETTFNFGEISRSHKTKRTHAFVFENVGDADLQVLHVASGCGCTVPKYSKSAVKPGKKGKIEVTFDAKGRQLGNFTKSVTVYFNSVKSYVRIFVKGKVVE